MKKLLVALSLVISFFAFASFISKPGSKTIKVISGTLINNLGSGVTAEMSTTNFSAGPGLSDFGTVTYDDVDGFAVTITASSGWLNKPYIIYTDGTPEVSGTFTSRNTTAYLVLSNPNTSVTVVVGP